MVKVQVFVFLIVLFCGCGTKQSENAVNKDNSLIEITGAQFETMQMQISMLQENDFLQTIPANGKIGTPPTSHAKVSVALGGFVKDIPMSVGKKVGKGQTLLTLESIDYITLQQQYLEIAGQIPTLKAEYERQKTLSHENVSSQKQLLSAESNYKQAKATYEGLRQKLLILNINPEMIESGKMASHIAILSPIEGEITAVNVNIGQFVSSTDVLLEVIDINGVLLELSVFEKDIPNLRQGQKIIFNIPQCSNEIFTATLTLMGKSVEGKERIVCVFGELDDETKNRLLPGMFVEAKIVTATRKTLSVPSDALIVEENNCYLLVIEKNDDAKYTFRKIRVETGEKNGDFIEIMPSHQINRDSKLLIKGVYDVN